MTGRLETVGVRGGRRGVVGLGLGLVLRLLGSRLGHVLWLLLDVLGLLGNGGDRGYVSSGSLEVRVVPALIVLAVLDVVVVQAGSDRGLGVVLGSLLLDVPGGSGGRSSRMWWGSRGDGQVVTRGTESEERREGGDDNTQLVERRVIIMGNMECGG